MKKILTLLLTITILTITAVPSTTAAREIIDRQYIAHNFYTRTEPSMNAELMCRFSPQYVSITDKYGHWLQINTWLGSGWVKIRPGVQLWTDRCVDVISRMVWGEGRGVSRNEQKLIVWTVINRLEDGRYGDSLIAVVRAHRQFHGYSPRHPVTPAIRAVVIEVLQAWERGDAAKVYPPFAQTSNYRYFRGDGRHNWFRENWR